MNFLKEFKQFALRGNIIDLAVAVVIGSAFGKIVSSLVYGVIMPLMDLLLGGTNIIDKSFKIGDALVKWDTLIQTIVDFTMIAIAIFVMVKFINRVQHQRDAGKKLTKEESLLTEIQNLLTTKTSENKS